ncbi:MAG: DNA translocase FtsK [Megasphaera sp.]|nr:DNA translocase FtsK [Megasphaera sp.]MCH4187096.1 DNA translocase FtsK [Megasphaera sp.]MCH4216968.1 DNA translocase FtsK [Megasphaera sp.]
MAQRKTRKTPLKNTGVHKKRVHQIKKSSPLLKFEITGLILIFFGIFATVGIVGVDTGRIGHGLDGILSYCFGFGRIVVSLALIILGLKYIIIRKALPVGKAWFLGAWIYAMFLGFIHIVFIPEGLEFMPASLRVGGGIIGGVISAVLRSFFGQFGAVLILIITAVVTALAYKKWSISQPVALVSDKATEEVSRMSGKAVEGFQEASQSIKEWHERRHIYDFQKENEDKELEEKQKEILDDTMDGNEMGAAEAEAATLPEGVEEVRISETLPKNEVNELEEAANTISDYEGLVPYAADMDETAAEVLPDTATSVADEPEEIEEQPFAQKTDVLNEDMSHLKPVEVDGNTAAADVGSIGASAVPNAAGEHTYRLPPVDILKHGKPQAAGLSEEVQHNAAILHETLQSFNIDATITNASQGPAVTRYELEPAAGVKVSKIVHLADDIALKLAATDIRIEAPIPGKAAVGIEVPNKQLSGVNLRDVLDTDIFSRAKGGVPVCLGKDIAGNPVVADLTKMPHLLVAGSTGSGKSVCINTFIASILFKQRPEDVKLILIDPKVVELSNYNGIPHLLTPVVTDPKKSASVLRWAVREMDDRYKRFAVTKTRDISRFNELHPAEAMPFVVIIIDELADLMMAASSDVEDSICRLAQKARACGMHLVLATQRPSVDVLTGLIKANVPSRIAFAVSSQVDSRTILDMAGAEKLIGKGDMLFYPMGASKPIRVQGAFISDGEIDQMVEYIKAQGHPEYDESVQQAQSEESGESAEFFEDNLMPQAIDMVLETGQASVSMLQRRFRVGYTRAARMIDMMEAMHIVGPNNGSKPREIMMSADEVQNKYLNKQ